MTRYPLVRELGITEIVDTARRAVLVGSMEPAQRAASAVRAEAMRLLPAHGRDLPDTWEPKTREEWARRGAYDGLLDAWEGSAWRAAKARNAEDPELYTAAYITAGSAAKLELGRVRKEAS